MKFVNAVLFFAEQTKADSLGVTKLNKLLYYADFLHYRRFGRSITGDKYTRMQYGPVPSTGFNIIGVASGKLVGDRPTVLEGKVRIRQTTYGGKKMTKIEGLSAPDLDVFSTSEREILEMVAKICRDLKLTGTRLSESTHMPDTPWSKTEENQVVSYDLILDEGATSLPKEYVEYWKLEKEELEHMAA